MPQIAELLGRKIMQNCFLGSATLSPIAYFENFDKFLLEHEAEYIAEMQNRMIMLQQEEQERIKYEQEAIHMAGTLEHEYGTLEEVINIAAEMERNFG